MFRPNLKSVALPVPEIIAIGVLSGGNCDLRTPSLGEEGAVGFGDGAVLKSIGEFL